MAKIFAFLLTLLIASHAHAQVVSQGRGGTSAWLVTGEVVADNVPAVSNGPTVLSSATNLDLALAGNKGATAKLEFSGFTGSIRFYTSLDGGVSYSKTDARNITNGGVLIDGSSAIALSGSSDTYFYSFVLHPAATHVRFDIPAYSGGSVTVTLMANHIRLTETRGFNRIGETGSVFDAMQIGGTSQIGGQWLAVTVSDVELPLNKAALTVRNLTSVQAEGSSVLGVGYRNIFAGMDADDALARTLQLDSEAPGGSEYGLITRNIPSGTQTVSGTVTANQGGAPWSVSGSGTFTVGATNLDTRDLLFASDAVDVTGSEVSITGSVEVTATDFDIRDLSFATDTVDVSGSVVSLTDTSTSGVIDALDETVELSTNGYSGLAIQFTGTWSGALRVETSVNGTDWNNLNVFNSSNPTTFTSEFTNNGVQFRAIAALPFVRVRANSWSSGSATVTMAATMSAGQGQMIAGPVSFPAGVSLTVDQGIGTAIIGDSWYTQISDGSDGPAEVTDLQEAISSLSYAVLTRSHITDTGGTAADVTAANALKVDGSAVTQPVSGSGNFTVVQPTGTNLHVVCDSGCGGAATFADDDAFTFGTTSINISGFVFDDASPNAVTENSAAAPRMSGNRVPYAQLRDAAGNERGANVNSSNALLTDQTTIGSNAISTGVGASGTGTQRVAALVHDGTDTMLIFSNGAAATDTFSLNGTTIAVNNGSVSAGTQRVTIADDSTGEIRVADNAGNQIPSSTSEPAETDRGLFVREVHPDPCKNGITTHVPISTTAGVQLVAASGSTHVYVCSVNLVVAAATNVAMVSGTGSVCATSTAGVFGGATAATGWNFAVNGGIAFGNGDRMVGRTVDAGDALCLLLSAANQTSGSITYVQQ